MVWQFLHSLQSFLSHKKAKNGTFYVNGNNAKWPFRTSKHDFSISLTPIKLKFPGIVPYGILHELSHTICVKIILKKIVWVNTRKIPQGTIPENFSLTGAKLIEKSCFEVSTAAKRPFRIIHVYVKSAVFGLFSA